MSLIRKLVALLCLAALLCVALSSGSPGTLYAVLVPFLLLLGIVTAAARVAPLAQIALPQAAFSSTVPSRAPPSAR